MVTSATTTVRHQLGVAFRALRAQGYAARMNFSCCGSCGHYELAEQARNRKLKGYVFWHSQSNDAFKGEDLRHALWLGWSGSAAVIVEAMRAAGLHVEHDGTEAQCIQVVGLQGVK